MLALIVRKEVKTIQLENTKGREKTSGKHGQDEKVLYSRSQTRKRSMMKVTEEMDETALIAK